MNQFERRFYLFCVMFGSFLAGFAVRGIIVSAYGW